MAISVLIVDDSPAMRAFIRRVLEVSGLEIEPCFEAGDGQEALEILQNRQVDVVLSDINMPRMSGEEFVERLAVMKVLETLPVIVVSTDSTEARMRQMLALGARGYVRKPFTPERLKQEIDRVLEMADE